MIDYQQEVAISEYLLATGRLFVPGDYEEIPIDALVFARYQTPWTTLEEYQKERCHYDPETNEWLVNYITEELLQPHIPPVYVDITETGLQLVDGKHRVTAHLIAGHETILVQLNKE